MNLSRDLSHTSSAEHWQGGPPDNPDHTFNQFPGLSGSEAHPSTPWGHSSTNLTRPLNNGGRCLWGHLLNLYWHLSPISIYKCERLNLAKTINWWKLAHETTNINLWILHHYWHSELTNYISFSHFLSHSQVDIITPNQPNFFIYIPTCLDAI